MVSLNDAATRIFNSGSAVIFCDTCALLDIIRLPVRQESSTRLSNVLDSASTILDRVNRGTLILVAPPPVTNEWSDHSSRIRDETARHIASVSTQYEIIRTTANHKGIALPTVTFPSSDLADYLYDLSSKLLNVCLHLKKEADASLKANDRAASYTAPASKGTIKDCLVYEHTLEVMNSLHIQGFSQPQVLLTSNTNDFCEGSSNPKPPIDRELSSIGATLCTSWDWTLNMVDRAA